MLLLEERESQRQTGSKIAYGFQERQQSVSPKLGIGLWVVASLRASAAAAASGSHSDSWLRLLSVTVDSLQWSVFRGAGAVLHRVELFTGSAAGTVQPVVKPVLHRALLRCQPQASLQS